MQLSRLAIPRRTGRIGPHGRFAACLAPDLGPPDGGGSSPGRYDGMTADHERLRGRTCMITGATSGIGKAAAVELARMGAEMILVCRDRQRGQDAADEIVAKSANRQVGVMLADLSSQEQIRGLAREFLATGRPLHLLINNAGLMMTRRTLTVDGIETTIAVNHLSAFLLTNLLIDRVKESAPARVVNVASSAHRFAGGRFDFDALTREKKHRGMRTYGQSKLANILFTRELARRLAGTGVTANCLHPGTVATRFASNNGGFYPFGIRLISRVIRTPEKGAETLVHLAAAPELEGVSGKYFFDRREKRTNAAARRDEDASRLWEVSAQMTGLAAS